MKEEREAAAKKVLDNANKELAEKKKQMTQNLNCCAGKRRTQ